MLSGCWLYLVQGFWAYDSSMLERKKKTRDDSKEDGSLRRDERGGEGNDWIDDCELQSLSS